MLFIYFNQLKKLDLGSNSNIGDEGARSLIPCLKFVGDLDLSDCKISEAVKEEISAELRSLGLQVSYAIDYCLIGHQACTAVANVIIVIDVSYQHPSDLNLMWTSTQINTSSLTASDF